MKVALVYDRVSKWGGAERVLLALHEMFPNAPLYTSVYSNESAKWASVFLKVHTSFIQTIPFAKTNHEYLAPLMPFAFELFDFSEYDLVISVTSEAAKGIITSPNTLHICYCLTPTRYLWSGYKAYFDKSIQRYITKPVINYLKKWDQVAATRPDAIISISSEVQNRIKKYYNRDSKIIFPPVNTQQNRHSGPDPESSSDYYLLVSRLVKYKKIDLAIKTFNKLGKKLVIIGKGREEVRLKNLANKNIIFKSKLTDTSLRDYYMRSKALIFPQLEDFGIVAVEAQASGTPVIAYKAGGVLDTVTDGKTGVFFTKQTVNSLASAVKKFENLEFNKNQIIKNAQKFSKSRFKQEFTKLINQYK